MWAQPRLHSSLFAKKLYPHCLVLYPLGGEGKHNMQSIHKRVQASTLFSRMNQGSNAILVASSITSLSGFMALALDIGFLSSARMQLQSVADVTAQAAAASLNGTDEGLEAAEALAITVAGLNEVWGDSVVLSGADVITGAWDGEAQTFTPTNVAADVNAIQIDASLASIPTLFAGLAFGQTFMQTAVTSTAVARSLGSEPAGTVECYLPLAIPSCMITEGADTIQDINLVLNPSGADNTGWARIGANPNAAFIQDQIGDCQQSGEASVDQEVQLMNGVVNSGLQELRDQINAGGNGTWNSAVWGALPAQMGGSAINAAQYGNVFEAPILILDVPDTYCTTGGSWTGSAAISGFAWAAVYDVRTQGPAANMNIKMRIDISTERQIGSGSGGLPGTGIVAPSGGGSFLVQ